jgi:hypothetical protein
MPYITGYLSQVSSLVFGDHSEKSPPFREQNEKVSWPDQYTQKGAG